MSSKIPRLFCPPGTAKKTDYEKLHLFKGARPKQTAAVKLPENMKTNGNSDPTKKKSAKIGPSKFMKNKNELHFGLTIPKTATRNKNTADFPKKESSKKGCVKEHENIKTLKLCENRISYRSVQENTQKQLYAKNAKPENSRKTGFKNKTSNKLDKSSKFAGLSLLPKESTSESRRRSLSAPGKPVERRKDKTNDNQIAHTNKSKNINRRDLDISELSNSMKREVAVIKLAQEEFLASKKNVPHGGLEFRPNLKKRKPLINFNINKT